MPEPQRIAIQPMAQQLLVQKGGEDWTGVTSTAQRRKLQNRLNKRSQYLRKRRQLDNSRLASNIVGRVGLPTESLSSIALALESPPAAMFDMIRRTCEVFHQPDVSEKVFAVACKAYMDYTMNAPRISQLPFLITLNVTIAVSNNANLLGFDHRLMCIDEAISPFNTNGPSTSTYNPPAALMPTEVQKAVLHHPWLDIFPFPRFRDNLILAVDANLLDDGELCEDISEINWENVEKPSLIVWGDASQPHSWEVSPWFLRKWGWLLQGCPELLETTNRWRQSRGDKVLKWHTAYVEGKPSRPSVTSHRDVCLATNGLPSLACGAVRQIVPIMRDAHNNFTQNAFICLDNLAGPTRLRGTPSDSFPDVFIEFQALAASHVSTQVRWVLEHSDISGNEQADKLTKAASSLASPESLSRSWIIYEESQDKNRKKHSRRGGPSPLRRLNLKTTTC
ncbi:hypothetical protein FHETE_9771 [Fusarium heterosporum]|uniref:RNase H type-1 domain-containing protein n=1 Tax=Fusarium heterosporum TaxID=42747 RepID=A0A8H5STG9_FUSHE|nr:hypothetical protein FHETE_9771 [Fusarium heterosporum]